MPCSLTYSAETPEQDKTRNQVTDCLNNYEKLGSEFWSAGADSEMMDGGVIDDRSNELRCPIPHDQGYVIQRLGDKVHMLHV